MSTPPDVSPSYLDWSKQGKGRWWRYLIGSVLLMMIWSAGSLFSLPVFWVDPAAIGVDTGTPAAAWTSSLALLVSFIGLFLGVPLVVRFLHKRPWRTVITPYSKLNFRLMGRGALYWFVPLIVMSVVVSLLDSDGLRLTDDYGDWARMVLVVLALVWMQTTAEELFFRGYLMQWVSLASRRKWVIALASGFLFTVPHLSNPEVTSQLGFDALVMSSIYFTTGFALGWVSVVSGTIELAIGAHWINNVVSFLLIAPEQSVATGSLLVDASPDVTLAAIGNLVVVVVFIVLCRRHKGSGEVVPLPQEAQDGAAVAASA